MDAPTATILQHMVRKEGRSLLQYVSESFPWTTHKNSRDAVLLLDMAKEEQEAAAKVVSLLLKNRLRPPYLGAYPMSFTTINYMSMDFLIPYLIDFEKRRIAELERDVSIATTDEFKELVKSVLEMKRRHLAILHNMLNKEKPAA